MQQKASAHLTIPLTGIVFGPTMGALGHINLQTAALGNAIGKPMKPQNPYEVNIFL
jgi:hypothetical protein